MPVEFIKRLTLLRMHHVVHADVLAEPVFFAEGVVAHADQFFAVELCLAHPLAELRGFDEFGIVMGAFG